MATITLRVLLFLLGVVIAGGGTAYFAGVFDPLLHRSAEASGRSAPVLSEKAGPGTGGPQANASGDETGLQEAPKASVNDGDSASVVIPVFDVLRAEPDGSLVIAGMAAPGAEVQVLSGSTVLDTAEAGVSGEFVAVLDEPLQPGEHNIVLRATSSDNVATSVETAIVSIPSAGSTEVVALVQKPGEPSRLISVPEAKMPPTETAEGTEPEQGPAELPAELPVAELPGEQVNEPAGEKTATAEETLPNETPAQAGTGEQSESVAEVLEGTAPDAVAEAPSENAPETTEVPAEQTAEATRTSEPDAGETVEQEENVAANSQASDAGESPSSEPQNPASDTTPFIEAVEIDGREIFVAGRAEPGRRLRIYANDVLLGQTTATPEGRFLLEDERDLPVGDYIIRADVLDDDGATVIARAAVPFERHSGKQIAAIAPEAMRRSDDRKTGGESTGRTSPEDGNLREGTASERQIPGENAGTTGSESQSDEVATGSHSEAVTPSTPQAPGDVGGNETVEAVVSPPLHSVDGAVIIRRGDTLWQISRRVYGRGIRYTTIYSANQDQIHDPHWIWPGQIFTLPDETEDGVKADLEAIGEQALTPEGAAGETRIE